MLLLVPMGLAVSLERLRLWLRFQRWLLRLRLRFQLRLRVTLRY
jgi:hypothetical protein